MSDAAVPGSMSSKSPSWRRADDSVTVYYLVPKPYGQLEHVH